MKSTALLALTPALLLGTLSTAYADDDDDPYAPQAKLLELGAYGGVFLPSSRHELYDSRNVEHQRLNQAALDIGLRAGYFFIPYLGAELEGGLIPTGTRGGQSALGYTVRGHLVGQYPGRFTPFAVLGFGALGISSGDDAVGDDGDATFHWGLGGKYALTPKWSVRLDGRHIVGPGYRQGDDDSGTSHFEVLAGVTFTLGRKPGKAPDPDGDGVRGDKDKCPTQPARTKDGCPPPDSDGDGVTDADDLCPNAGGPAPDGCPDSDGDGVFDKDDACPKEAGPNKGCPVADRDGDGIADDDDKCADEAGVAPDGCPDLDPDKDGVLAADDKCPDEAGVAPHGCPDADGDGIADADDQCKDEPETKNGFQDTDGCPDELPKAVKRFTGAIKGITFSSGSAKIRKSSFKVLDKAVAVLLEYDALRLEIGGHTDNRGKASTNTALSQKRADAVKQYFVDKGIDEGRLVAKGYGPELPAATNRTRKGRAQNRRIEFKLLSN